MEKKICPRCETDDVNLVTGGISGEWECKECGYANDIFPEKMRASNQ